MSFYPIFLNLEARPCLVVGGGKVAERKVLSLVSAGADVTVVSPRLTKALKELAEEATEKAPKTAKKGQKVHENGLKGPEKGCKT